MKILVTGRSGTGKSAVCRELQSRGLTAFDGDKVDGLAGWVDLKTKQQTHVDYGKPIKRDMTLWWWDGAVLRSLLKEHADVFLCGSADNDLDNRQLFDKVFALTLPPNIQRQRILARTEHGYGKQPGMIDQILVEQQEFIERATQLGVSIINAEPSPVLVVDEIVRLTHES